MTDTDDLDEILQGFGVDPDDPHRRRDKANKLRSAGVDPSGAELVFCHLERTSADLNRVPRLVAAMALDPAKLLRTVDELRAFHVKQEERKPPKKRRGSDAGQSIRRDNERLARIATEEWERFAQQKRDGTLPAFERRDHPWERSPLP